MGTGIGVWPPPLRSAWVIDLDGVIWLAGEEIPGAAEAVLALREKGWGLLFATNNSSATHDQFRARLARIGIEASEEEIVGSADAAATCVPEGARAMVIGGTGLREALSKKGVSVVEATTDDVPGIDAVLVGWTQDFTFERLAAAARAVRKGAILIGTNADPTFPTPNGLVPGSGSLLAAVSVASETEPIVAGKPHEPMANLITASRSVLGVVVGDRPATDGLLATRLHVPYAQVLSGVSDRPAPEASIVAADLLSLVSALN